MKILKESKDKLPIDFITQFVSKGWEEVGNLKASIEGIKHEFKDTKKVEDILQDLVDAYLIAIGQMELHLDKKDYVELPKEEELKEALEEGRKPADYKIVGKYKSKEGKEIKVLGPNPNMPGSIAADLYVRYNDRDISLGSLPGYDRHDSNNFGWTFFYKVLKDGTLDKYLDELKEALEESSVRTIQDGGFDFTDTEGHTAHFYTVVDPDTDLTSYYITDGIDKVSKDGVVARQALREILDFIKSHLHNRKNIMLSWNMEADGSGDCIVSIYSQDERNRPNQYRTLTNWAEAERMIRNALHLHNKPIKTNNYSNDDIKNKFQGYVYQEALTEAYRNYCVLDVNNNVLYDDYGDDVRKALIDLQNDSRAYSVNRYFTPENDEYVPNSYEDVAYKNKDGKIEIYKNRFYNDEWFNCCSGLDKNKIVLHESNEEEAKPIEAKKLNEDFWLDELINGCSARGPHGQKLIISGIKDTPIEFYTFHDISELGADPEDYIVVSYNEKDETSADVLVKKYLKESSPELAKPVKALKYETEKCKDGKCCKKTEIFTELPDYDVEVEQKGEKIEIELEPKNKKVVDGEYEMVKKPEQTVSVDADWFVDFDEPDFSEPRLTDKDLYPDQE